MKHHLIKKPQKCYTTNREHVHGVFMDGICSDDLMVHATLIMFLSSLLKIMIAYYCRELIPHSRSVDATSGTLHRNIF